MLVGKYSIKIDIISPIKTMPGNRYILEIGGSMFSIFERPFGSPNAVIYSYEVSRLFLSNNLTSILEIGCGIGIFALRYTAMRKDVFLMAVDQAEGG